MKKNGRFLYKITPQIKYVKELELRILKLVSENYKLRLESRDNWIPASKSVPNNQGKSRVDSYVLGSCPLYYLPILVYYDEHIKEWRASDDNRIVSCEAWQPLPKSYSARIKF